MENPMKYNLATRLREGFIKNSVKKGEAMILDIGCGIGYFTELLSGTGKVYGIEIEKDSLAEARRLSRGFFSAADGQSIPFKDETFDYVLLSEVIEHLPDDLATLREVSRVLKKGGILVLTTESREGIFPPTDVCHRGGTEHYINYTESYTRDKIMKLAEEAGFQVLETKYTLTLLGKLFMELAKRVYIRKDPNFSRQSDIRNAEKTKLFGFYKKAFPLILALSKTDSLTSKLFRGTCIMVKMQKKSAVL